MTVTARQAPFSPSIPQLRPYQADLVDKVRQAYREGKRCPMVVLSTGGGKTMIFSHIAHSTAERDNGVLIAAHRKEIIRQISLSLARFGVEHQVIAPPDKVRAIKIAHYRAFGRSFVNQSSTTMVGSVQTIVGRFKDIDATMDKLAARLGRKPRMLVVMDEAHHVVEGTQWGQVMDRYVEGTRYDALGLLVTASPKRLDGRGLGKGHGGYADCLIEGPSMKWLMGEGYLSDYVIYGTPYAIDTVGVGHRMGEFISKELEERTDRQAIRDDTVRLYREHAWGMRAVAFCASVKASKNLADTLNRAGIPAAHIDGEVDDDVRDQAIIDFATGKLWVLTQVNLVSEGFDLASIAQMDVTIDCVIDVAPTESLVNFMQRGGRMLRPAPGKVGVYLDQAGNFDRHGTLEMERTWSLEGGKKGSSAANDNGEADVTVITCTTCYAKFDHAKAHAAGQLKADRLGLPDARPCCPVCQTDVQAKERKVKHEVDQQLVLKNKAELEEQHRQLRREELREQAAARTLEELVAKGKAIKQAEAIIQAREEKAQLYEALRQAIREWHQRHRLPVKTVFGIYTQDIDRMKPKQMKELLAKVQEDDRQRREANGELFPDEPPSVLSIAPVA